MKVFSLSDSKAMSIVATKATEWTLPEKTILPMPGCIWQSVMLSDLIHFTVNTTARVLTNHPPTTCHDFLPPGQYDTWINIYVIDFVHPISLHIITSAPYYESMPSASSDCQVYDSHSFEIGFLTRVIGKISNLRLARMYQGKISSRAIFEHLVRETPRLASRNFNNRNVPQITRSAKRGVKDGRGFQISDLSGDGFNGPDPRIE